MFVFELVWFAHLSYLVTVADSIKYLFILPLLLIYKLRQKIQDSWIKMVSIFILLAITASINLTLCSNVPNFNGRQMNPFSLSTQNCFKANFSLLVELNMNESMKQPMSSRCVWWWFSNYRGNRYYNHDHFVNDCFGCGQLCRDLGCSSSRCSGTVCRCRRCLRNF